ncbi:MAG: CRISPR-associated protein Cas6 [Cyclobacteriaceae bacterium]|nr:CRISPR-associated protein Cas6 [Cyclobacteriaceae bacterium HetDA_MAG_MS6]
MSRIRITFQVGNRGVAIPFHHQFLLAQIIRGLIVSSGDNKYQNYSFYSFSGLKGQTRVSRNGLHYTSSRVTLVISSLDKNFLSFLVEQVFSQEVISVGPLFLNPEHVDEELMTEFGDESKFICISPVVLLNPSFNSDTGKRYIEPSTDEFSDFLFESTLARMEKAGWDTRKIKDIDTFQVVPDQDYINKLRQSQKKFSRIFPMYHQDVKYEVRGYTFPFTLYASKEVQEFLFVSGLGNFSEKGFGMIDLANSNPVHRTVPYQVRELVAV